MLSEIMGPDLLVILLIVFLLFGGSQLPKLARSLGEARRELETGLHGNPEKAEQAERDDGADAKPEPPTEPRVMTKADLERLLDDKDD
jgi:sec-independent protein translocase protein TatA